MGNVLPLAGTSENTATYIEKEVKAIVPGDYDLKVGCYRVSVQRGHTINICARLERPAESVKAVADALLAFEPAATSRLHSAVRRPIAVFEGKAPQPADCVGKYGIIVGGVELSDEGRCVNMTLATDNVKYGAWGVALLCAELFFDSKRDDGADSAWGVDGYC